MDRAEESKLVAGLIGGETRAFVQVYVAFRPRLFGFLVRLTGQSEVAEDLMQETFLRLASHAPRLRPDTRLGAWLFTVARNLAHSWRRWRILDAARIAMEAILPLPATPRLPVDDVSSAATLARVEVALRALAPESREVLLLVGVEGFEPAEAAEILGIKPEALRQRLSRARKLLAARLAGADHVG